MSIAGKWNVTMHTPIGTVKFAWDFTNDAGEWRGRMIGEGPVGDSELRSIQVNGDAVSFETTTKSPMGALDLVFIGSIASDALSGTCKTRFGDNAFSAARA